MKLLRSSITTTLFVMVFALGTAVSMSFAEDFPTKHITIICGFSPGGGTDIQIRGILPYLQKNLDKGVMVETRTGANGLLSYNDAFSAQPDGYTLMVASIPAITIAEKYFPDTAKYEARNYSHIYAFAREEIILVTHPAMYKSFQEFLKAGTAKKLKIGTVAKGSPVHLGAVMLEMATKMKTNIIPFEGAGESMASLAGKHIDAALVLSSAAVNMTRSGIVKPLLILGEARHPGFPDVPSAKELGYNISMLTPYFTGVVGPPRMPAERIKRLESAFADAVKNPDYLKWANNLNLYIVGLNSEAFLKETLKGYPAVAKYMEVLKQN